VGCLPLIIFVIKSESRLSLPRVQASLSRSVFFLDGLGLVLVAAVRPHHGFRDSDGNSYSPQAVSFSCPCFGWTAMSIWGAMVVARSYMASKLAGARGRSIRYRTIRSQDLKEPLDREGAPQ